MTVTIRLFALARDLANTDSIRVELPSGANVAALRSQIAAEHPELAAILSTCMFAVDNEFATDDMVIDSTMEIACLPPVSGG